ncbi:MAG TPA: DMT family transporter [Alphaproteobacteria bacterium]|nr:DMT family transporter [Alphaproteobacteria bacterium]
MTAATKPDADPLRPMASSNLIGYAAIAVAVTIWAGFALSIRAIGASALATADVALIRFGVPAFLLCAFLPSRWRTLLKVRPTDALMVLAGAGLPFFWIAAAGGAETSAAHVGALIAGTVPVSVALLAYALNGTRASPGQLRGLAVIVFGVIALVAAQSHAGHGSIWKGAALLLTASVLWGAYTIGLRRTGLDAIGCTLLLTLPSFMVLMALFAGGAVKSHLGQFTLAEAMPFLLIQGLGVGVVASLTYAAAIARLGPSRSAAIGSLAPALASIGAVPLLGEALPTAVALGVGAITVGVILANRT